MATEVKSVAASAAKLCNSVVACEGEITSDQEKPSLAEASTDFVLRLPLDSLATFLKGSDAYGILRARDITTRDIFTEYHDAQLELHNAKAALETYERLLARANTIDDVLKAERELTRIRGQIDGLKARMAWMQDRTASATVSVRLYKRRDPNAPREEDLDTAPFYPGVQAQTLFDIGAGPAQSYAGGGLSLMLPRIAGSRGMTFEFSAGRAAITGSTTSGAAYSALLGSDVYSSVMGRGIRRFLNPYVGWRAGYVQTADNGNLALGAVLGVDVLKTKSALLDLHVIGTALSSGATGLHFGIAPTLRFSTAF